MSKKRSFNKMIPERPTKQWSCPNCGRTVYEIIDGVGTAIEVCTLCGQHILWDCCVNCETDCYGIGLCKKAPNKEYGNGEEEKK